MEIISQMGHKLSATYIHFVTFLYFSFFLTCLLTLFLYFNCRVYHPYYRRKVNINRSKNTVLFEYISMYQETINNKYKFHFVELFLVKYNHNT